MAHRFRFALAGAVIVGALSWAVPAHASTPLPAPTNVQAVHVSDTSADLWWLADGLTKTEVIERKIGTGAWQEYARGFYGGALALPNLTPGTTYSFRIYAIPFEGLDYTTSDRSVPVTFTTLSGPDSVPPTPPAAPTFSSITTTFANVFWPEATDNVQVTGYYLQQLIGGSWTTIRTVGAGERFQTVRGLAAATTYTFAVIAFDARGNVSARSAAGSLTTLANTPYPTCQVQTYLFSPGFLATVTIINTTTAPLTGWTIQFTLPATATVSGAFNGILTRSGSTGTITPPVWANTIGLGGMLSPGFSGSATPFTPPTGFTLNGRPCTTTG